MIQFSCADYTFPLLPPAKRFALLKLLGFKYVDIGIFERDPNMKPSQLAANPRRFIKRLQTELQREGLRASDVFLQIGQEPAIASANDPSQRVRSHNRKAFMLALDLCDSLGCKHLTGLPGVRHKKSSQADDLALAQEEAAWRQQVASEAGVRYAIEAHIGSLCPDVASARSFVESVPDLTLTVDYGHFVFASVSSHNVHSLLPFASHIHVRGGAPGRLQTPLSENTIDFEGMMRRLRKQQYSGTLAVEYVWTDWQQCNRTDNVSEALLLRRLLEDLENEA